MLLSVLLSILLWLLGLIVSLVYLVLFCHWLVWLMCCGFVLVDFVIHADVPCAVGSLTDVVDMMSAAMAGCVVVGLVDCEIVSVVSE